MARSLFLEELMNNQSSCHTFPHFSCSMEGDAEKMAHESRTQEESQKILQRELCARRKSDSLRRGTSLGPHRSLFRVTYMDKNQQACLCSTGEQKMLVLALLLATLRARSSLTFSPQSMHASGLLLPPILLSLALVVFTSHHKSNRKIPRRAFPYITNTKHLAIPKL